MTAPTTAQWASRLPGTNSRSVGDAASHHAGPNHGCNAHSHGNQTTSVNQVHCNRRPIDSSSCACGSGQARSKVEVGVSHPVLDILRPSHSPIDSTNLTGHAQPIEGKGT